MSVYPGIDPRAEFECPQCESDRFRTSNCAAPDFNDAVGHCKDSSFMWSRCDDDKYFKIPDERICLWCQNRAATDGALCEMCRQAEAVRSRREQSSVEDQLAKALVRIEELEAEKEEIDCSRSSMVSHRDLEIRDLKDRVAGLEKDQDEAVRTLRSFVGLEEGGLDPKAVRAFLGSRCQICNERIDEEGHNVFGPRYGRLHACETTEGTKP